METPNALLAQPFTIAAETWTVTDDAGTSRAVTVPAGTYRVVLGAASTHTADAPGDLLTRLNTSFGSSWHWKLRSDGRAEVAYLGPSVTVGVLTPPMGGSTVLTILGALNPPATFSIGDSSHAPYLPTHCIFAATVDPDTGWEITPGRFAGARLPEGPVYGWGDRLQQLTRTVGFRLLPRNGAVWSALATAGTAPGTPAEGPRARWLDATALEPAQAPPWGAMETIATAGGQSLGWTTELQGVLAGTVTSCERVYLTPDALTRAKTQLSVKGWDPRRDLVGVELAFAGEESLT